MKPNVYVTRKLHNDIIAKLKEACHVTMWPEEEVPVPRDVLDREIADVDGLYCLLTENIDARLLEKAKKLKIVANMAVGFSNIDVDAATARNIMVTNTPGVLTETTAELTVALMMATARRLIEASDLVRQGKWVTWSPMKLTGHDLFGATLGIVGMGRIGEAVARMAKAFHMKVIYHNRSRKIDAEEHLGVIYAELDPLMRESDFVCVLAPLTSDTYRLISKKELSVMKPSAILINTSRGGIVDEGALFDALSEGRIWGAGLDVFEQEPVAPTHPLLTLPNVVTLPHIGSASIRTRLRMGHMAADNLLSAFANKIPDNLVNPISKK